MNLIVVYDYAYGNLDAERMLLCWIRHINKFAKNCNVYIVYGSRINPDEILSIIEPQISNLNVIFEYGITCPKKYNYRVIDNVFHVNFNLYNVMKVYEKIKEPLIYMDLDAILLSDLNEWWEYVTDRSFIGTMHYPIGQNLNAGTYSLSGDCKLNFDELINRFFENKKEYKKIQDLCREQSKSWLGMRNYTLWDSVFTCAGNLKGSGDQPLYINYFVKTNESPYYEKHGPEWNVFSSYVTYNIGDDGYIHISNIRNRMGFNVKKVKLLHAYAGGKKKLMQNLKNSNYYK